MTRRRLQEAIAALALVAMLTCGIIMHATGSSRAHEVAAAATVSASHGQHAPAAAAQPEPAEDDSSHGAHGAVQLACLLVLLTAILLLPPSGAVSAWWRPAAPLRWRIDVAGPLRPPRTPTPLELSISRT